MNRQFVILLFTVPSLAFAGVDQPLNELDNFSSGNGDALAGLVLLAIIAFAIRLLEQGALLSFLGDIGKGIVFIAGIYLVAFIFLACIVLASLAFQVIGLEKSTSGFFALPIGIVIGYKIFSLLITAQERKKNEKNDPSK